MHHIKPDRSAEACIATDEIRAIARSPRLGLAYKLHAQDQLLERGITSSDVLFVLKYGFVLVEPEPATRAGFYRYAIENKTPNSDSRDIRLIVIPDKKATLVKLVTVMWVDELATRAGSIIR
jgi:hypothetical protein